MIEVPFLEASGSFTWGVWAEVPREFHEAYLRVFQTEGAEGMKTLGHLANEVPGYDDAFGAALEITLHADRRPSIRMIEGSLAKAQAEGLTRAAHRARDDVLVPPEADEDFEEEEPFEADERQ